MFVNTPRWKASAILLTPHWSLPCEWHHVCPGGCKHRAKYADYQQSFLTDKDLKWAKYETLQQNIESTINRIAGSIVPTAWERYKEQSAFCVKWGQQQNILVTVSRLPKIPPVWFGLKGCFFSCLFTLLENTDPSTACESIKPPLWRFISSAVCGTPADVKASLGSWCLPHWRKVHRHILSQMESQSIMQRKLQTFRYLKFLHHNKQWDLLVGLLFGASCWFGWQWSGGVRLTFVTWRKFGSQQSVSARTLHPTLLLKMPLRPPMAAPSGWGGGRTNPLWLFPGVPFSKGHGTVHFPQAGDNKWKEYLIDHSFIFSFLRCSRCIQSWIHRMQGHVGGPRGMEVGTERTVRTTHGTNTQRVLPSLHNKALVMPTKRSSCQNWK